jgi:Flagellar protein FlhE
MFKRLLVAAMTLVGLVAAGSGTAQAAESLYGGQVIGPTMYQTNWTYVSNPIQSPAGTPSTGVVTRVNYQFAFNGSTPPGLQVQLCNLQRCALLPNLPTNGFTTAFAGDPAVNTWTYKFTSVASTTYVFKPSAYYGGTDLVNVYYQ